MYILYSTCDDVYRNLAYETRLLDYAQDRAKQGQATAILFLWQNDNTIVIGKHQNPYKECNLDFVKAKGIKLARRISGGGAVYHDRGNLNFSFILPTSDFDKTENFALLTRGLRKSTGLEVALSGRNDILIGGKKFSGNAYVQRKYACLHHGTILIDSDASFISQSLTPDKYKLASKGVSSVQSRIVNLKAISQNISIENVSASIAESFAEKYGSYSKELSLNTDEIYQLYSSDKWIYGDYLDKGLIISSRFAWGGAEVCLLIENNRIAKISIASDSLETKAIDDIMAALSGAKFDKLGIKQALVPFADSDAKQIIADIESLICRLIPL